MATPNLGFQNFYTTTLSSGITATDTTIYLNSLPTPTEGYLVIEPDSSTNKEIIYYTSKGANFVTLPSIAAGRGVGATTAVSHNTGVTCQMNVVAEHFEALQDGTAFAVGGIGATPYADGWTPILGSTPNTVTYNGNRNYDLVFNSVDLTSTLSPGMKLKATRTVAAPTKCTDLEASSSQYYSKTSPAGMTFTDDFTVSAWIKLESYPASTEMNIASRWNGTSGWYFDINQFGQVRLVGSNAGAGNVRYFSTYQAIPLNKWVHVAAQLDMSSYTATSTTCYAMIDGVDAPISLGQGGTNPTAIIQAGNLEIGSANALEFFDGKIAQVAIYSAKVTQATIKASCNQTLSGSETSLISAYSFNNTINDLNTTNANNLTANGSAVATDTDSPFANAVTAGLLEYAEVNSATFSTNTTINIKTVYNSQIPTSGGVSAMAYSTHNTPYGYPNNTVRYLGTKIANNAQTISASTLSIRTGLSYSFVASFNGYANCNASLFGRASTAAVTDQTAYFYSNGTVVATTDGGGRSRSISPSDNPGVLHVPEAFIRIAKGTAYTIDCRIQGGTTAVAYDAGDSMKIVLMPDSLID